MDSRPAEIGSGPHAIGEEPVMADAMKTVGEDVQQEAADEFVAVERH